MPAAVAPPPAAAPDPRAAAGGAIRVLFLLAGFILLLAEASHLALVHSARFLAFARGGDDDAAGQPMRIEATLRALRPGEARIIGVGSSVLFSDVDAPRLAERYGLDLLPLSLFGGTTAELAMLTPRVVEARPQAVVVLATVWTLFDHVDWAAVRVYDPHIAASLVGARQMVADRQAHASHLLGSSHFVIRHRASLRARIGEAMHLRLGATEAEQIPDGLPPAVLAHREATAADFSCTGVNGRALELMARRMREAGITFVIVPTPADSPRDRDEALWQRLDACLAGIAARTGARVVLRPAPADFPFSDFENEQHMNASGRRRFTDRLGVLLQHALAPRSGDAVQ